MVLSARRRIIGSLLAVLCIGGSATEPVRAHACGMHTPMTMAAPDADGGAERGAGGAAPAVASVRHTPSVSEADAPAGPMGCACTGPCHASSPPVVPTQDDALRPTLDAPTASFAAARPRHAYVAAWVDFVLPPTTAPPAPSRA